MTTPTIARAATVSILLAAAASNIGCLGECLGSARPERHQYAYCSHHGGSATVAGPAEFPLYTERADVPDATGCLADDGACSAAPSFGLTTYYAPGKYELNVDVELPPQGGAATYALPSPSVTISSTLVLLNSPSTRLTVVSGRIEVDHSDGGGFHATFEMELETPAHQRFTISDGVAGVSGCEIESNETCEGGGDFD